uniref:RNA-binding glycine-rich protein n=1 Tax=Solanum tuberosum TaxID=4113 RepID=M1CCV2_SOLTU
MDSCHSVLFIGLKMALFNRIGNMLKQSVSRHTNLELCASRTSLYQAIRSMSSSKLFVGGKRILFPVGRSCYALFPSFCCSIMANYLLQVSRMALMKPLCERHSPNMVK